MVKNPPVHAGAARDTSAIPWLVKSPGVGNGNPFQYSCLENSMDRGTWWAIVHGIAELDTTEHIINLTKRNGHKRNSTNMALASKTQS